MTRPIPPEQMARIMRGGAFSRRLDGKPRHVRIEPEPSLGEAVFLIAGVLAAVIVGVWLAGGVL
ncbi:MAG: hypothetical protein ACREBP_10210 [Sphingomicrobium sp.]